MSVMQATTYVLGDEKALAFLEMDLKSPLGCDRRYEIIRVVRDDKEAEYRKDIGAASHEDVIRIPSYMEHTVNELRLIANQLKSKPMDKLDLAGLDKIRYGN